MRHYRTIIWDWNGTLLNDAALGYQILAEMCSNRKMAIPTFEDYQRYYEHPVERIYERCNFDLQAESIVDLCDEWHAKYTERLPEVALHHDALEMLQTFERQGRAQVVLSALPHDLLIHSIEKNGVGSFFLHVHGLNDNLSRSKIENGHLLMKKLQCPPRETVLIGDSSHDVETAAGLGIDCLLVARGYEHREKLERHNRRVFADFSLILREFTPF